MRLLFRGGGGQRSTSNAGCDTIRPIGMLIKPLIIATLLLQEAGNGTAPKPTKSEPPQWYEVVTGVIAIPAGLLGLVYAHAVYQKTKRESRKLDLEIAEKEVAIGAAG